MESQRINPRLHLIRLHEAIQYMASRMPEEEAKEVSAILSGERDDDFFYRRGREDADRT